MIVMTLLAFAACGSGAGGAGGSTARSSVPAQVDCTDARQLRQRAADDRRLSNETRSDQEKIFIGNRAGFFASLAVVADLKCKVTLAQADEALKPALEAARRAEKTSSTYAMAQEWGRADFIATEVISLLIRQLPASSAKESRSALHHPTRRFVNRTASSD